MTAKTRTADREFMRDEVAGSAVETALIFSLAATMAVVVRESASLPLLQKFLDAAKVLEGVLG